MNLKYVFLSTAVLTLSLVSCKKDLEPQESSVAVDSVSTQTTTASTDVVPAVAAPQPVMNQQPVANTVQTVAQPSQQTAAKGMNPAHGQPGHRCDIPVGSPLNSPVKPVASQNISTNAAQPPATISPSTINSNGQVTPGSNVKVTTTNNATPAILNAPTETKAGMNPAHGQPGHRCDVAVGAALPK